MVLGFVRIATHARAFQHPMTPAEAAGHVRSWLEQPPVQVLDPGPDLFRHTLESLETLGTAGNLVSEGQGPGRAGNQVRQRRDRFRRCGQPGLARSLCPVTPLPHSSSA